MVFGETLVHDRAVLHHSYRALKLREGVRSVGSLLSYDAPLGTQLWQFPAVLTESERNACDQTVRDTVRGLELQQGVFGMQLVLDDMMGCALLEINLRPHGWPLLYETTWQAYFSDLWGYGEMSLLLAVGAPKAELRRAAAIDIPPPPLVMDVACRGCAVELGEMSLTLSLTPTLTPTLTLT